MSGGLLELAARPLMRDSAAHYWPVLAAAGIYAIVMLASFRARELSTLRRAFLATGAAWTVYLWGLLTILPIVANAHDWHPHHLIRVGLESSLCLFAILLLLIPCNLLARRIRMPTAFTLGVGATIAAVYADLLFVLWLATPVG